MATIKSEAAKLALFSAIFAVLYFVPLDGLALPEVLGGALSLAQWYAREHVLLCLIPALFIAGAIAVFISKAGVLKYLGPNANQPMAYGVASVSGSILAVCSCTVLPLFAGIYKRGAGLGPATAFLYSGPAINILAIILTARVLGAPLGIARAIGAVVFAVVIGLIMAALFRNSDAANNAPPAHAMSDDDARPLYQTAVLFVAMVLTMVFATWGSGGGDTGWYSAVHSVKWILTSIAAVGFAVVLHLWYGVALRWLAITAGAVAVLAAIFPHEPQLAFSVGIAGLSLALLLQGGESSEWLDQTWTLAKQILPLLLAGVFAAGLLLGPPGGVGLIPLAWVEQALGGNSFGANLFASVAGALMYFATLTEVPILKSLMENGMGNGPTLALLLAGPALSLPNMLVIRSVMGTKKTAAFVMLVVVMATASGLIFGSVY